MSKVYISDMPNWKEIESYEYRLREICDMLELAQMTIERDDQTPGTVRSAMRLLNEMAAELAADMKQDWERGHENAISGKEAA